MSGQLQTRQYRRGLGLRVGLRIELRKQAEGRIGVVTQASQRGDGAIWSAARASARLTITPWWRPSMALCGESRKLSRCSDSQW